MGESDFSGPFIVGFGLGLPGAVLAKLRKDSPEISRFPRRRRLRMPGSTTTRGRPMSRDRDMGRIAFCRTESIGAPKLVFAAQWLAYAICANS